jgi:hypothetical protein
MRPPNAAEIVDVAALLRARIDALLAELDGMGPRPRTVLGISLIAEELRRLREVADAMVSPRFEP